MLTTEPPELITAQHISMTARATQIARPLRRGRRRQLRPGRRGIRRCRNQIHRGRQALRPGSHWRLHGRNPIRFARAGSTASSTPPISTGFEPLLKTAAELAGIARFCDDDTMLQTVGHRHRPAAPPQAVGGVDDPRGALRTLVGTGRAGREDPRLARRRPRQLRGLSHAKSVGLQAISAWQPGFPRALSGRSRRS